MAEPLLNVQNISVSIDSKQVLKNLNLKINPGETHVLMGPNGAGKSTLGNALMGNPLYTLNEGKIIFDGKDISNDTTDKRAKDGMFLSFQNPLEVPGISVETFIRSAIQQKTGERVKLFQFQKELKSCMELLNMDSSYASRDLNVGFSGGERKKSEILQLLMLHPKFAILDETDSGLDVDSLKIVGKSVMEYYNEYNPGMLLITHYEKLLKYIKPNLNKMQQNFYANSTKIFPGSTESPSLTKIEVTVPASGATISFSIFIASKISKTSCLLTLVPTEVFIFQILPGIGA